MKLIRFVVNVFKILRAMFILWFLKRYTHPETIPLFIYGTYKILEGDVAVIQGMGNTDLGEVVGIDRENETCATVKLRLFRRPNA